MGLFRLELRSQRGLSIFALRARDAALSAHPRMRAVRAHHQPRLQGAPSSSSSAAISLDTLSFCALAFKISTYGWKPSAVSSAPSSNEDSTIHASSGTAA